MNDDSDNAAAMYVGVTHVGVLMMAQSTPTEPLKVTEKHRLVL